MAAESISFTPSGNISDIQYDPDTQTLYVLFHTKRVYRYPGVTADEANGFGQSLSANDYLQRAIIPQHTGDKMITEDAVKLFG